MIFRIARRLENDSGFPFIVTSGLNAAGEKTARDLMYTGEFVWI
jgi:hypothetical protein